MRILLIPMGSSGDVHPFVGIGIELKKRGHKVTVLVNGYFRQLVERAGLGYQELGTAEEFEAGLDDPDLWHPTKALWRVADLSTKAIPPTIEAIKKFNVPGQTMVVAGTLAMGARIAEEKWGIPTATIHLQPSVVRSVAQPAKLPGLGIPPWLPASIKRAYYRVVDLVADNAFKRVNEIRREVQLIPVQGIMGNWPHSPRLSIGMFPKWFAPPQKDWPKSIKLAGFPLYDGVDVEETSADAEEFLNAGSPPVVFTAGSAMKNDRTFFEESDRAVRILGCRAVYLTRFPEQLPEQISVTARTFTYVPFSHIFPRALAIVTHGGIGSVAQALRSGRPQLVVPRAHDQFDNGARVERLNAGKVLPYSAYRRKNVAAVLRKLIEDKRIEASCRQVISLFEPGAIKRTADLIESSMGN